MPTSDEGRFIVAVAVLVFRGDRLLAMRRSPLKDAAPGAWEALSGRVRTGEEPLHAARRETLEECGLRVAIEPRPVAAYRAMRNDDPMLVVAYRARSDSGDVALSAEHDAWAWMTLEEFAEACPFAPLVEAARAAARLSPDSSPDSAPGGRRSRGSS
ncbi:MAG TPA: NUDIX domain-containing protein [Candidatus Polarisedimenticolia bacterium]|nr:NUDIX domain-containing protein [Candidatus Polarisedimenticolia bacterium]